MLRSDVHAAGLCPPGFQTFDLELTDPRWAEFAASRPEALPYHHPSWLRVLREACGYRNATVGCADSTGRLCGILPLVEKNSILTGLRLSSLPHTPAGPPALDGSSLRALLWAAKERVDAGRARWVELKVSEPGFGPLMDGFSRHDGIPTYVLDLPENPEDLRFGNSRHHAAIARAVRKQAGSASRSGRRRRLPTSAGGTGYTSRQCARMRSRPGRFSFSSACGMCWHRPAGCACCSLSGSRVARCSFSPGRYSSCTGRRSFSPSTAVTAASFSSGRMTPFTGQRSGTPVPPDSGDMTSGRGRGTTPASWRLRKNGAAKPVDMYRYHYPQQPRMDRGILASGPLQRTQEYAWRLLPPAMTTRMGRWAYRLL